MSHRITGEAMNSSGSADENNSSDNEFSSNDHNGVKAEENSEKKQLTFKDLVCNVSCLC